MTYHQTTDGATQASKPKSRRPLLPGRWSFLAFLCLAIASACLLPVLRARTVRPDSGSPTSSTARKMLSVFTREDDGVIHFFVQNVEAADVTATFNMELDNLKCSAKFPYTATFPGNKTVEAFTLAPIDPDQKWNYNYSDVFTIGSMDAVHDDSFVYLLPYAEGKTFRVTQGYHGAFSHTGPDEYAIDWKMPVGTPVHAARGGLVVKVKDDSDAGGPDRKYENAANCILIRHDDATVGIYAHLKKHGARVKVGQRVNAGDLIALSGNTGFTSGPHLHFSVFKTCSGRERVSLPVRFMTADSTAITLVSGQSYRAGGIDDQQNRINTMAQQNKPANPANAEPAVSAGGLSHGN